MRSFLPVVCSVFLISYGCAGGESTTAPFGGGDDGGGAGDDAGIITGGDSSTGGDAATHDAATDSGPLKTCVHNDDCTSPNICSGTNGQACMGGFCVPTGKPENCDDGVACTDDSCDANANKCKHTPNDASCPNGSYCDTTMNCVQTLPCMTAGDTVCDRLDTTSCDGLWSCDTVAKHCVHGAKPCLDRANATTMCTPMGQSQTCNYTCAMGYVDSNMDLNAMGTSNGCECHATDPIDKPTLANVDGNCDGIVGNIANAIFVDTVAGNDGNPGTKASPKKTIQSGIGAALAANPIKDVYVSKGGYTESVSMADGVSVYGGYDAANGWARSSSNITAINSPTTIGVDAQGLTKATELQLVTVTTANAAGTMMNGDGMSAYGVVVAACSGGFTVRGCTITAGTGAQGSRGSDGATGAAGGGGGNANGTTLGGPGSSACGAPGGGGGPSVNGATQGSGGGNGGTASGGGVGGGGGGPGSAGSCSGTSSLSGGTAPGVSSTPGNGNYGTNGNAGTAFGSFSTSAIYNAAAGGDGLSSGFPGGGGGGGGSGGGSAHGSTPAPFTFCTDCQAIASGAGGGGGGGGCGGALGHGGRGGGGSFAIVAISSAVTVDSTKMQTGVGGRGGDGGNGGNGGGGGGSGNGGHGNTDNNSCSSKSGGDGANGGAGGSGGRGGGGGGGSGGPSACVIYKGTSPTSTNSMCTLGGPGAGGTGGSNGNSPAATGTQGQSMDTIASP